MRFLAHVTFLCLLWLAAALPTRLLWKELKVTSLAGSALMAVGAYSFARSRMAGFSWLAALGMSCGLGMIAGICIVGLRLRLAGNNFALATFAFQILIQTWLGVAISVTGGPLGLSGFDAGPVSGIPSQIGFALATMVLGFVFLFIVCSGCGATTLRIVGRSPELAATLGIQPALPLIAVGCYYGVLLASVGVAVCAYYRLAEPNMFQLGQSMSILAVAAFGQRRLLYLIAGVAIVVAIPELTRLLGADTLRSGYLQLLLSGLALCWAALNLNRDVPEVPQ